MFQDTAGTIPVTATGQTVKRINNLLNNTIYLSSSSGFLLNKDISGKMYLDNGGTSY